MTSLSEPLLFPSRLRSGIDWMVIWNESRQESTRFESVLRHLLDCLPYAIIQPRIIRALSEYWNDNNDRLVALSILSRTLVLRANKIKDYPVCSWWWDLAVKQGNPDLSWSNMECSNDASECRHATRFNEMKSGVILLPSDQNALPKPMSFEFVKQLPERGHEYYGRFPTLIKWLEVHSLQSHPLINDTIMTHIENHIRSQKNTQITLIPSPLD